MTRKKILPPTYFFIAIIATSLIHFIFPIFKFINFPWNLIGIIPLIIGIAFNILADNSFKKHATTVKPFEESSALVTNGTFRISRNPMYLGMALILFGIGILLGLLSPYFVILIFILLLDFVFIQKEEAMLQNKFGAKWLEYKNRVRRWL